MRTRRLHREWQKLKLARPGAGTPRLAAEEGTAQKSLAVRLEPLLAQLRELGAAEYALEPWGAGRQMYRFRCEMPLGTSEQAVEQFEAMARRPAGVDRAGGGRQCRVAGAQRLAMR